MITVKNTLTILTITLLAACRTEVPKEVSPKQPIIIGYVGGFRGEIDETTVDVTKLTHINYAFVDVKDSMAWLTNIATDTINFRKLVNRKNQYNPDLKILISVGGWTWSKTFSDAVLTESSRRKFAETNVKIVEDHDLDGVDIDWEYPGLIGDNNVFRPEDKQNYTLMFKAIREELDKLTARTGKNYQLTTAVGAFKDYIHHTEMGKAQQYLDYVNLMTYDFHVAGPMGGHHTNLYPSEDYDAELSAHRAVKEFAEAGVPVEKLVMGIAFYGRSWFMQSDDNRGINRPIQSVTRGGGYTFIKDSLLTKPAFERHWDDNAKAPYLFNAATNQLVTYDDEESVRYKCEYVMAHNMGGVMFWEYSSDKKEYLLNTINESFGRK